MEDKNLFFQRMEAELGQWSDKIAKLKDATKNVNADIETQYYEQVEDLMALHELARQKLQEVREYGEAHWEDYKAAMEKAMSDLSESYGELESHFRQQ
jgi:hypothetical protein